MGLLNIFNSKHKSSAQAYHLEGLMSLEKNELTKAINNLTKCLKLDPNFFDAYNDRGLALLRQGKYNEAIHDFTKFISNKPYFPIAYWNRGIAYCNLKQYNEAILNYNEAIRLDPFNSAFYYDRGLAYIKQGDTNAAVDDYITTINKNPHNTWAYCNLAKVYIDEGKYMEAIKICDKGLIIDKKDFDLYLNKILACAKADKILPEIEAWKGVIKEVNINDQQQAENLGAILGQLNKFTDKSKLEQVLPDFKTKYTWLIKEGEDYPEKKDLVFYISLRLLWLETEHEV